MSLVASPVWDEIDPAYPAQHRPVAVGGDCTPEILWGAFRRGLYPWPASGPIRAELEAEHGPAIASGEIPTLSGSCQGFDLPWWCPTTRGYLDVRVPRIPKDVRRVLRRSGWTSTTDECFNEVVAACARPGAPHFWISDKLRAAYDALFRAGQCHSVEVWDGDALVGGLFGVQVGRSFSVESMFTRVSEASRVAMVDLCSRFLDVGGAIIDLQGSAESFERLGSQVGTREEFLAHLSATTSGSVGDGGRLPAERLHAVVYPPTS